MTRDENGRDAGNVTALRGGQVTSDPDLTATGPARKRVALARWHAANPLAAWAYGAVRSAVRRGLIVPQACEICGSLPVDAHHDDDQGGYERPLGSIKWLCRRHHQQHHGAQRRAARAIAAKASASGGT